MVNIKSAVQTIFRYCRISYQACTTFEDLQFKGFQTTQRISFDDIEGNRVNCFFVSGRERPSLLDHENTYGVIGIGRPDSDYKYQYASIEEMVTYYSLMNKHIALFFSISGSIAFGKEFDYTGVVEMNNFEITDTTKYSFLVTQMLMENSKNTSNNLRIFSDVHFEINCNERYSTIEENTLVKFIQFVVEILDRAGLSSAISRQDSTKLFLITDNIQDINAVISLTLFDNLGQQFNLTNLFIPTSLSTEIQNSSKSEYSFMFRPGVGKDLILGTGFLHHRVVDLRPDSFSISKELVETVNFETLPLAHSKATWGIAFNLVSSLLTAFIMIKSCQGCTKTLGQIK